MAQVKPIGEPPPRPVIPAPIPPPESSVTDYLRDIHGELVEMRKLLTRIANATSPLRYG